jgi:hypothetical protein
MDAPNAFIGKTTMPTPAELSADLVDSIANERGLDEKRNSLKPTYGWNLTLKSKTRRIVYLGPCVGCSRVPHVLSDRAVAAASASNLL